MKSGIVYHIFCTVNGKCYIGQTWSSLEKRWGQHINSYSQCKHLSRAISLYGESRFIKTVLTSGLTKQEDMDAAEIYWISYFDSIKNGYNIKEGGAKGRHSQESKDKISAARLGMKFSEETRAKISAVQIGRIHSDETKAKMSRAHSGKKLSDETKAKISAASVGKTISDETRAKMSAAKRGNKNAQRK